MDKVFGAILVLALIFTALTLMFASWQRRRRRDLSLVTSTGDGSLSTRLLDIGCFYVATTPTVDPLERLAIPGLAFRARAMVGIGLAGIVIDPNGEIETFISRDQLVGVRSANATIDRSAGPASLTAIDWTASNGRAITSFLRIPSRRDRALFLDTVTAVLFTSTPATKSKEQSS